jgi:hypothetical protein
MSWFNRPRIRATKNEKLQQILSQLYVTAQDLTSEDRNRVEKQILEGLFESPGIADELGVPDQKVVMEVLRKGANPHTVYENISTGMHMRKQGPWHNRPTPSQQVHEALKALTKEGRLPPKLHHGTTSLALPSIGEEGLLAKNPWPSGEYAGAAGEGTYWSPSPRIASDVAGEAAVSPPGTIESLRHMNMDDMAAAGVGPRGKLPHMRGARPALIRTPWHEALSSVDVVSDPSAGTLRGMLWQKNERDHLVRLIRENKSVTMKDLFDIWGWNYKPEFSSPKQVGTNLPYELVGSHDVDPEKLQTLLKRGAKKKWFPVKDYTKLLGKGWKAALPAMILALLLGGGGMLAGGEQKNAA